MYIYLLLVLLWLLIYNNNSRDDKWKLSLKLSFPLMLLMGMRHVSVGSDTSQYLVRFEYSDTALSNPYHQYEKGYDYLNYLIHDIWGLSFNWLLLFVAMFTCLVMACFISKYSTKPIMSYYLYLTIGSLALNMSGIRQTIAISICWIALMIMMNCSIKYRYRIILALALNGFAYTFHNSSVIFVPFLLLTSMRLTKRQTFLLIMIGMSSIVLKSVLVEYISIVIPEKYSEMDLSTNYVANMLVLIIPIAIALFCLYYSGTEKDGKFRNDISLMFIFVSCVIFFYNLKTLNGQIGRLSHYFMCSYLVLIPYTFSTMKNLDRKVLLPVVMIVCALYFVIGNSGDIMQIDDYHFFWEDVEWINRVDLI